MLIIAYITIYLFVFTLGATVGSFLNVLIYRLPRRLDFARGFSHCPGCGHRLFPKDLVPVFSYLVLGRKCRYCKEPISPRYMTVELTGGVLALLSCAAFMPPAGFLLNTLTPGAMPPPDILGGQPIGSAILYFAVLSCLLTIAWIDHDTMEIPDSLNIAIAICGVIAMFMWPEAGLKSHLIGLAVASVPLFLVAFFIEGAFGFGDVKLMAAAGLFLGWQRCLVALFIGVIIGGAYGVFLLAAKRKGGKEHFAFGPSLCAGIGVSMFAGEALIKLYIGTF